MYLDSVDMQINALDYDFKVFISTKLYLKFKLTHPKIIWILCFCIFNILEMGNFCSKFKIFN